MSTDTSQGLNGKVMAIPGGGSGIGQATAREWVARGGTVVVMDINEQALDATVAELGSAARGIIADVTSRESVDAAFESIRATEGRLDALLVSAGNAIPVPTADITDDQYDALLQVHLAGAVRATRAAYPLLKETLGTIVLISSVAGRVGMPQRASYNTVKHGLIGLTKSLAVEWASDGIRVNAVAPGYTWTPFNKKLENEGKLDPAPVTTRIPLDRWAQPEEIAKPIIFLSTPESSYVSGHTLFVDGAMSIAGDWYD